MTRFWLDLRQVKSSNLQASSRFRARSVFHKRERSTWLQIPCPSKGQLLYCKETFRFYQKVLRNLFLPNARVFDWQHVWWRCFSTDTRHAYGTNCVPLLADMFLYLCEADYAGSSREKRKEALVFCV